MKKKLAGFVERRNQRKSDGTPAAGFHSRAYHRYFEGYIETVRVRPDGRRQIERVYTGVYHRQDLTKRGRILLRLSYAALWLLSAGCFALGAWPGIGSNRTWYVTVPEMAAVAALFWVFCTLVNYFIAPADLTVHDFRTTSKALRRSSLAAVITIGIVALTKLIYLLLHLWDSFAIELMCLLPVLAAAAWMVLVYCAERHVPYQSFQSRNETPENGAEIT